MPPAPAPRPPMHCARRAIRMQSEQMQIPMLRQTAKAHPCTRTRLGTVTQRTHVRCASHAAGAEARTPRELERQRYPFPAHANPTPREIFHLPPGASQVQIKERYIALVRAHHPDAHPDAPDIAHARFRAVQAAYDVLSGRSSPSSSSQSSYSSPFTRGYAHTTSPWGDNEYIHELARRKRAWDAAQGRRARAGDTGGDTRGESERGYAEGFGPRGSAAHADADEGWREDGPRERAVLAFGVALLVAGLFPSLPGTLFTTLFPISPFSVPPGPDSSPPPIPNADSAMRPPRFLPDLDRGHRAAAAALAQTRVERAELGPERRAGVRRRVRGDETEETRREEGGERPAIAPPPPPAVDAAPAPGEKRGGV